MKRRLLIVFAAVMLTASPALAQNTEALLDTLQHTAFDFFWQAANPGNGLVRDRATPSACSIASMGFGFSAIPIGIDHGWITRPQGRARVKTMLNTLYNGPQGSAASGTIGYQGLYYHFLDMTTATRSGNTELSTIDTALLFAGMLDARMYFDGNDPDEVLIRALADTIYRRANWNFMRNFNPGILMGWNPGTNFSGYGEWVGYNEAMILYVLALGSPTKAVPASAWSRWTSGYTWDTRYGQTYVVFGPLFGHQYSHCWIDFRNIRDPYMLAKGIDYFENSRRATLAQRAYAAANPGGFYGYSDSLWGITAGDGPFGYTARGAPPSEGDDGTITPTAAISSLPFAPAEVMPMIRNLWNNYRGVLWGPYGWKDGINLSLGWVANDVIGIDQGPILLMIENHRTGRVWNRFMSHPDIQRGLAQAGFVPWVESAPPPAAAGLALSAPEPNPCRGPATLRFRLREPGHVTLDVLDVTGRVVDRLRDETLVAGDHVEVLAAGRHAPGLYWVRLRAGAEQVQRKLVLVR